MKETKIKIGLVLAGGGAKGAYQSGVVKYLAEIDFAPVMIAGTSIGALNGAILASGTSFKQSSDRLWQLWRELGEANIITPGSLIFFGVREIAKKTRNPGVVMVLAISRNLA